MRAAIALTAKHPLLLTLCLLALLCTGNASAQTLIPAPDSNAALSEKWGWGSEQASDPDENSAWVAYQFSVEVDEKLGIAISSNENDYRQWNRYSGNSTRSNWVYRDGGDWRNGLSLQSMLAGNTSTQQDYPVRKELLFLANFAYGELREVRVVDVGSVVNWHQSPVHWLGRVAEQESFRLLLGLFDSGYLDNFDRALARAIGLHRDPDRNTFLISALANEDLLTIRPALLEGIAQQESIEVQSLLMSRASDENETTLLRRIAISALSRYDSAAAEAMLIDLAGFMNPQQIRQEALESLGLFFSDAVTQTLRAVVLTESSDAIVEEALASLSRRPDQFDTISSVAQTHSSSDIREEAISLLAKMDILRAFDVLQTIAEADADHDIREEAIGEMEEVPQQLAVPYLIAFAEAEQRHPVDVRKEAVESLSNFAPELVVTSLNQLAWSDSNEDIREQAVESLADLKDLQANTLLLEIARNHPSQHTRREALDSLEDNVF